MLTAPVKTWRWTVARYDQAIKLGWFADARIELIEGKIVNMSPQLEPHAVTLHKAAQVIEQVFGAGYWVRRQFPLALGRRSKPEPDIAVVTGSAEDYLDAGTPTTALLVVEVSDTTLAFDRGRKASMYAKHGISDYWIVNLVDRQLECHRQPIEDPSHRYAHRYVDVRRVRNDFAAGRPTQSDFGCDAASARRSSCQVTL